MSPRKTTLGLTLLLAMLAMPVASWAAAPVILGVDQPIIGTAGTPLSYQIQATGNAVFFSASPLPTGLVVNSQTGLISGNTQEVGTIELTLTASNQPPGNQNETNTGSAKVNIIIKAVAPTITNALEIRTSLGRLVVFPLAATGFPKPTFTISTLPPGLTLQGEAITGIPLQGATINATLTATNSGPLGSGGTDVRQILINVTAPPQITSPLIIPGAVGVPIDYRIAATNNPFQFGFPSAPLAGGITINTQGIQTGLLSGTPTMAGRFEGVVTATNNINYDAADPCTFTATTATGKAQVIFAISTVNGAPAFTSLPTLRCFELTPLIYNCFATNAPTRFYITDDPNFADDANLPGFTDAIPTWLNIDEAQGVLSGFPPITAAPAFDTPATYNITLRARNQIGVARMGLSIVVDPADPRFTLPDNPPFIARPSKPFAYQVVSTFYPPESGVTGLTYSISFSPPIPSGNIVIHPTSGKITGTPEIGDVADYSVTVTATNNQGSFSATTSFVIRDIPPDTTLDTRNNRIFAVEQCPIPKFDFGTAESFTNLAMTTTMTPMSDMTKESNVNLVVEPTGNGVITGTPGLNTAGTYELLITGTGLVGGQRVFLTISPSPVTPAAPTITSPSSVESIVGTQIDSLIAVSPSYTNAANNLPPLVFSGNQLPVGTSLGSDSQETVILGPGGQPVRLIGTPLQVSGYFGSIGVVNATGSDLKPVIFTITPIEIFSPLTAEGTVGLPFFTIDIVMPITAGPADDDTPYFIRASGNANSYTASGLPPGLAINPQTGQISGFPIDTGSAADVTFNVQISASNGFSTDTETLVITIHPKPANAPSITNAAPLNVSIFDAVSYPTATPVFDVNATGGLGGITYKAIGLPQGLFIDPLTGIITGTTSQLGTFPVTLLATADQNTGGQGDDLSDAELLQLTVLAVPPVLDTSNFNFSTPVGQNFSVNIGYTGSQPITLSAPAGTLPTGVVLTNQALLGIPAVQGVYTIPITASGPGGTDVKNFVLTVTRTPGISGKNPMTGNITVPAVVGLPFSYTISAVGFEPPTFTIAPSDITALAAVGLTFNGTTISGTPTEERPAGLGVAITATNSVGVDTATLIIQIRGVEITSPLIVGGAVGQAFSYTIAATGNPTTFTATNLPAGLTFSGNTISGVPIAAGQSRVPITAANALSSATATLIIAISATPGAPAITSALTTTGVLNTPFTYAITATNSPTSYSATGLPAGLTLSTSSGLIIGSPTETGSFSVTISAINSIGTGSAQLVIAIAQVSGGPAITSPLTATAVQGQAFTYQITSIGAPVLTFGAGGLPAGLSVNSVTGLISGTPNVAGSFSITLQAANFATATAVLQLTVVSQGAVITSPTTVTSPVGQAFSYVITATGVTPITYSITGTLPSGLTFDPATAAITGVPTVEGSTNVTMTASNAFGTDNKTLTITIGPRAPSITSALTASGQTNVPFTYQITAAGSTPITFAVAGLPPGLSVNTATGLISGTPGSIGTFNIFLSATNVLGSDQKTLVLTVTEALDDFDQDGFPNELEIAFGSDPQNPNSTPFGGTKVTERGILSLTSVKIKLNFATTGGDSVTQKGSFALPAGYVLANKNATVVVGGFKSNLGSLTDKGSAVVGTNKISIKPSKNGAPAKYSLTLKGDLKNNFADEGLTNDNIDKKLNATRTVRTFLLIDATGTTPLIFENSKQLLYTAKQGKTGSASGK